MDVLAYFAIAGVISNLVNADTYTVTLSTEQHINEVDTKFLSFTIDPKYLFSSNEKYKSKECICMASSLSPAYIQIAGKSTSSMNFRNSTISIDTGKEDSTEVETSTEEISKSRFKKSSNLSVSHKKWEKFVRWAKSTGFELVFALNNEEKTSSGMWDPNTALRILTSADKANIGAIFWQLGYECTNQTIEEYLNDLETLNVIVDTFPSGKSDDWRVVGGDVTKCLQADSKSDFKDYVTLSNDMFDAIMLNGNSSSHELDRMSEKDRYKLLKLLSSSVTPLWLTEHNQIQGELERAADWMTSLGFSARNGFSVHFRELLESELYEPTLSFYMALLFKNLVGDRVLNVDIEATQAILFAHCTSLRHKPVPGAVTFFGVNMDDEPARFSIKLSKKEEGGDIMQFILKNDRSGNIVVNGRAMFYEGDIKPVVKRVRPYKTLIINLPAQSFGFWVLANTQVDACFEKNDSKDNSFEAVSEDEKENSVKIKRSLYSETIKDYQDEYDDELLLELFSEPFNETQTVNITPENQALFTRIDRMNKNLKSVHKIFTNNVDTLNDEAKKKRRHVPNNMENSSKRKSKILNKISNKTDEESIHSRLSDKIIKRRESIRRKRARKLNDVYKKQPHNEINTKYNENLKKRDKNRKEKHVHIKKLKPRRNSAVLDENKLIRQRRSVNSIETYIGETLSTNKINDIETFKDGIVNKIKKLTKLSSDTDSNNEEEDRDESNQRIVIKTKVSGDSAQLKLSDKANPGLVKGALQDILTLLADLNKHLNKFWNTVTVIE